MLIKQTYIFKRGQAITLDDIYTIQGLGGGDWWQKDGDDLSENIIITCDIKFEIRVTRLDDTERSSRVIRPR